ncbi:RNA polymerase factor sigma-32, partial [Acinetobacter baumannii]
RRTKAQMQALEEGDLRPEHVTRIATKLGVSEDDVISMNRRLGGDSSLNAPLRADTEGAGEWQDFLADDSPDQEEILVDSQERAQRRGFLTK